MTTTTTQNSVPQMNSKASLSVLVQGTQSGFLRFTESIGLPVALYKQDISLSLHTYNACVIANIGIAGHVHGGIALALDMESSEELVRHLSGGMIQGNDINNPLYSSCIGEAVNMIAGGMVMFSAKQGIHVDITPPQIFTGEKIKQFFPSSAQWMSLPYLVASKGFLYLNVFAMNN